MNTISQSYKSLMLQAPFDVTTTSQTSAVELSKYAKDLLVNILIGAVTGTSPTLAVDVQTSEDGSTGWTTQATVSLVAGSANKSAQASVVVPVTHRYVRLSYTAGGTTPHFLVSGNALVRAVRGGGSLNSVVPA